MVGDRLVKTLLGVRVARRAFLRNPAPPEDRRLNRGRDRLRAAMLLMYLTRLLVA